MGTYDEEHSETAEGAIAILISFILGATLLAGFDLLGAALDVVGVVVALLTPISDVLVLIVLPVGLVWLAWSGFGRHVLEGYRKGGSER